MSAITASQPSDLAVLPDAVLAAYNEFAPYLTEDGRDAFLREIMIALRNSHRLGNNGPIIEVLEAWHRTLILLATPGFTEAMDADEPNAPMVTADEMRAALVG